MCRYLLAYHLVLIVFVYTQSSALAMQEQERVASEEAEKRLKATLAAKRDPTASTSRIASPNQGDSSNPASATADGKEDAKTVISESKSNGDVEMAHEIQPSPPVEVSPLLNML